jgi:hypothetical protein
LKDLIVGWVLSLLMTTSLTKMCDQPSKVLCFLASIEFNQISNFIIPIINEHGTNTSTPNLNIDDVPSFFLSMLYLLCVSPKSSNGIEYVLIGSFPMG